jgi:predicted NAD/FAD-dependent oxidoreductase
MPLSLDPSTCSGVSLEVAIAISIALFKELKEGIAECRVHAHAVAWVVAANAVPGKALFEEGLVVRATAVEHAWRGMPSGVLTSLAARVMPSAE